MPIECMEKLQGIPSGFYDFKSAGVSEAQYGHMLGNVVSANVFMRFLPRVMMSAGLITEFPIDYWQRAIEKLKKQGMTTCMSSAEQ